MANGCTGQCCAAFPLTITDADDLSGVVDGEQIRSMIVPITAEEAVERMARLYPDSPVEMRDVDKQWYRCIHWDEETRLCKIYEDRPQMCRDYPGYRDGTACDYGCDCTDRRSDG